MAACGLSAGVVVVLAGCGSSGGGTFAAASLSPSATASAGPSGPALNVSVTTQPACAQGTNNFMTPGHPGVVSWRATGVTNVTISVDGPGLYGTYGLTGSQEFAFSCNGAEGSTETHSYTFNTVPAGLTRTITMSAISHTITTDLGNGGSPAPVTPLPTTTP